MKILFLDQTGKLGGAERSLLDIAYSYRENCLVVLFEDGPYRELLAQRGIPVQVISNKPINVRRESNFVQSLGSLGPLAGLMFKVLNLSRNYDLLYANTPKALVVGAFASFVSGRPLIYHLRDILTPDHFSHANRRVIVTLVNRFVSKVIAVSEATQTAFVEAGGRPDIIDVVYNGFQPEEFQGYESAGLSLRHEMGFNEKFIVGHFSRFSPWKGQHILIEALKHCSENVIALLVGDALFGEQDYAQQLHQQVKDLGLEERVKFLGFRSDVPQLMAACDVVTHTSTAPEPCSRVLIETMLCGRPLVATLDGGTVELVENGETGWLIPPGEPLKLASTINELQNQPEYISKIAAQAQHLASQRFRLENTRRQIDKFIHQALAAT